MTPLKIGACLKAQDIDAHRDWLFGSARDIELQDFMNHAALTTEFEDRVAAACMALDGHTGRRSIHGPYAGLDIDNKDPELRPLITARLIKALEAADRVGARQMVVHSPFTLWYQNNIHNPPDYVQTKMARIHEVMRPVVMQAESLGITLVVENIQDVNPSTRRELVDSFGSTAIALSIDTGHAHLAHRTSGAPPLDYYVRDAGDQLAHMHVQDVDGRADRHWAPGEGEIEWTALFRALSDCTAAPHLVMELRDKADIPIGFEHLKSLGLVV